MPPRIPSCVTLLKSVVPHLSILFDRGLNLSAATFLCPLFGSYKTAALHNNTAPAFTASITFSELIPPAPLQGFTIYWANVLQALKGFSAHLVVCKRCERPESAPISLSDTPPQRSWFMKSPQIFYAVLLPACMLLDS